MIAAILGGLILGAGLREAHSRLTSVHAATALTLFQQVCTSWARSGALPAMLQHDLDFTVTEFGMTWIDRSTGWAASIGRGCGVTNQFVELDPEERAAFTEAASLYVLRAYPMLREETVPPPQGFTSFRLWASHPRDDPRRWVVMLFTADAIEGTLTRWVISSPHSA